MAEQELSNQEWAVVLELFAQMVDGNEPGQLIARQNDQGIKNALENLWRQHQRAERLRFLEDQITVVSEMRMEGPVVFQTGQILAGRFGVLRMLGRGGMGEVYLADDQRLMETVALKTIKRELARDKDNRARFLAEVQNSRRVTHPNVCRIFDFFEHDGVPFYSMEYVAGATLAEVLAAGALHPDRAKMIAIQAAEGLWTAHKNNILHCDFKPANIILAGSGKNERAVVTDFGLARALGRTDPAQGASLAGTPPYMAPELLEGEPASVRTDIYAFGKVLEAILPGNRLAEECTESDPNRRPASLETVLKELRGTSTRRKWIGGVLVGGAGLAYYAYEQSRPKLRITSHQRVRVNGFTPDSGETAKDVRNLLIMALRQSPLLSIVGDRQYQAPNRDTMVNAGFALPMADLLATARDEKANLAIEGHLDTKGDGLALTLNVYDPNGSALLYKAKAEVPDRRNLVHLAELAAEDLRASAFGESAPHSTYVSLEKVTSSSPEAVDYYFRAVSFFEKANATDAIAMADRAVAIDPDFVLARHFRARVLNALFLQESALAEEEKAYAMRNRVSERERNWIAAQYFNITKDYFASAVALQKNTVLYPDEAVFQQQLAYALVRLGRYQEAIPYNRRAAELDPFGDNNLSELLVNLATANRVDDCLAQAKKMELAGKLPSMIHRDLALAYLQKEDYDRSMAEASLYGVGAERQFESQTLTLAALIMTGRFVEATRLLQGNLALPHFTPVDAIKEQGKNCLRRISLGRLQWLNDSPGSAVEHAEFLIQQQPLPCNLIYLREGCALALDLQEIHLAEQGLDRLATIAAKWPSSHCESAIWLTKAMLMQAAGQGGTGELFAKAKSLWPDPINLFYAAQAEGRAALPQAQLATLVELERIRGTVFRHHFAGLVVLGWWEQAKCLQSLSRFEDALRIYDRVVAHWVTPQVTGNFMRQVHQERNRLQRRLQ